jgi:hypothetical protein
MLLIFKSASMLSIPGTLKKLLRSSRETRMYAEYGTGQRVAILLAALSRTGKTGLSTTPAQRGQWMVCPANRASMDLLQWGHDKVQNMMDAISRFPCAATA